MEISTVIARATSALSKQTKYESPGSMPSFDGSSWPSHAKCDCSGFVDWCLRLFPNRKVDHPLYRQVNGGWFETSAIYRDGLSSTGYFTKVANATPGALLVYPDYKGEDGARHDGHIGVVIEASGPGIAGVTKIVHCSLGNWKAHGDAVQETGPEPWLQHNGSIIVWLDGLAGPQP